MKASNKRRSLKLLSLLSLLLLTAAVAIFSVGCDDQKTNDEKGSIEVTTAALPSEQEKEPSDASNVRGEGSTEFVFKVHKASGEVVSFTVKTDKKTVGEALVAAGLIEGEDGPYGLYVKIVDGERHEYEDDGMYWAFYENDAYALNGVDSTEIESGVEYSLRASKG